MNGPCRGWRYYLGWIIHALFYDGGDIEWRRKENEDWDEEMKR